MFGEPDGERIADALEGVQLYAPALLPFEVANVCLTKLRRHPDMRDGLIASFGMIGTMNIEIVDVDLLEALELAETTGLTTYDASYLWLAEALGADLVTLDRQLGKARSTIQTN